MQDAMASLKSVAVGAVMGILREMFKQALPALTPHLAQANTKRGRQVSESPALQPASSSSAALNGVWTYPHNLRTNANGALRGNISQGGK
jgi:hypothetical protein